MPWSNGQSDVVWRFKLNDEWCYIYLLLEFQSSVDRFMAVRMMTYLGLLYEALIKAKIIKRGDLLPRIYAVVFYTGPGRWTAPWNLAELLAEAPVGWDQLGPSLSYFFVDECTVPEEEMDNNNPVTFLMRMGRAQNPENLKVLIDLLKERLSDKEFPELRKAFAGLIC